MQSRLRWVLVMTALVTMALVGTGFVCAPAMAAEPYMSDVLKKPAYARTLKGLFDRAGNLPDWTREALKPKGYFVEGTATRVVIDGTPYDLFSGCQPHNCDVTALVIMFGPEGGQAWGLVVSEERPTSYLGAPSAAQRAVMNRALPEKLQNPFD